VNNQTASWRVRVLKGVHVEVHVTGTADERVEVDPLEVQHAAAVLQEVMQAVRRIRDKWKHVTVTPKEP
jgi:hypothetical protein